MLPTPWLRHAASLALLSVTHFAFAAAPSAGHSPVSISDTLPDAPGIPRRAPDRAAAALQQEAAPAKPGSQAATQSASAAETSKEAKDAQDSYDLRRAEHQRILGVMPEFQAVNHGGIVQPLRPAEKFHLMWKSSTDPFIFALDSIVAGIGQAKDSNPGFHQGAEGYFKRFGASYADTFDGNFWGNAVLTVAFKEDPRYFREGEGYSYTHRALYSAGTALWTRRDDGKSGPNYANVLGNFISGGISNLYYPAADRGLGKTVTGAVTVTAEGTIGSELIEFWPDIAAKLFPRRYHKQPGD